MKTSERRASALFGQLSSVLRALSKDIEPKEVHRLRTSARRLESALAFFHPRVTPKQRSAIKELERLRRRAGKIRDCDIQIGLLDEIANRSTRADREAVAKVLKARREKQAKRLAAGVDDFLGSKSPDRMRKIVSGLRASMSVLPPDQPLADAANELEVLRKTVGDQDLNDPERLHDLRLGFKKIRYLAELGRATMEQKSFLESLKTVQDAIGRWHDWESLARIAAEELKDRQSPLLVEIDALESSYHTAAIVVAKLLLHPPTPAKKESASVNADTLRRTQTAG